MAAQEILIKFTIRADGTAAIEQIGMGLTNVGTRAADAAKKTESMFGAFLKASIVQAALSRVTGFVMDSVKQMISLGDALAETSAGFETLAQRAGIDAAQALGEMRSASDGLMTDIQLMTKASDLMGTGLKMSAEDMGRLTAAAKTLGEVHGVDLPQALDLFTNAIARGQDRALGALGVDIDLKAVTDALGTSATEAEKKQAAFNAILEKASTAAEGAAASGSSLNDNLTKLQVAWENGLAVLGRWLNESESAGKMIAWLGETIHTALVRGPEEFENIWKWIKEVDAGFQAWRQTIIDLVLGPLPQLWQGLKDLETGMRDLLGMKDTGSEARAATLEHEITAREILVKVAKEQGVTVKSLREGYDDEVSAVAGLAKQQGVLGNVVRAAIRDGKEYAVTTASVTTATTKAVPPTKTLMDEVQKLDTQYRNLTGTQKQQIVEALKVGISTADIAKKMDIAEEVVGRYATALKTSADAAKKLKDEQEKLNQAFEKMLDESIAEGIGDIATNLSAAAKSISEIKTPLTEAEQALLDSITAANSLAQAFTDLGVTSKSAAEESTLTWVTQLEQIVASGDYVTSDLLAIFEDMANRLGELGMELPLPFLAAWKEVAEKAKGAAGETKNSWTDALSGIGGLLGNLVDGIMGAFAQLIRGGQSFGTSMKNVFSGLLNNILGSLSQSISGWVSTFAQNLSKGVGAAAQIAGKGFSKAWLMAAKVLPYAGIVAAMAYGLYHAFRQRNAFEAVEEELIKQLGHTLDLMSEVIVGGKLGAVKTLSNAMMKEILAAISRAFGGITGGELENKIPVGIYVPEAQIILFLDQMKRILDPAKFRETMDKFVVLWAEHTRAVLMNELGKTEKEAAEAMQGLLQTALDELKKRGEVVSPALADLIAWAVRLGVEFDVTGLKIRNATGALIDMSKWLLQNAGAEMFLAKWKTGLVELDAAFKAWLDAKNFQNRLAGIGNALEAFFKQMIQNLQKMIADGLSTEQIAKIAEQLQSQLRLITEYQLTALATMRQAGMSTTQIWDALGDSVQKQLALMRQLGLEATPAYQHLLDAFNKLKNDAQLINGMLGPMIGYFQKLAETGQLTAKNFEKWAGVALSYLQRMIEAGATTAEIWQALSGIYDVLKAKHDEVMGKIQTAMEALFANNKKLTDEQKKAIEDYINGIGGSLDALAKMGVPQSLLDQIEKWKEMRDLVSGPVWDAFQRFYDQQKELQKWTGLMDQINLLFAAMGTNLIQNEEDLKTWSDEIHKYFNKMIEGGMSMQQIVQQYGGSLHQLYLEYQAQGKDVPAWLKKIEEEYKKQEAARQAADDAQIAAQIAMLEAMAALIKAIGGDVPDAIQDAIDALKKLRDAANGVKIEPGPGGRPPLAGSIYETRDAALDAAAAMLDIKQAIQNTTKEGGKFYEKMKAWLDTLTDMADDLRAAFKGSGVHAALLACRDAADVMGDALRDALKDAKKDTDDEEKKLEKLAKRLEQIKTAAGGIANILSGGISAGLVGPADISGYLGLAQKMISMLTAKGASFSDIFSQLQTYGATLEESWKSPLSALIGGMDSDVQKAIEDYVTGKAGLSGEIAQSLITQGIMPQIEAIKATYEQIANSPLMAMLAKFQQAAPYMQMVQGIGETVAALGVKIGRPMYDQMASLLMQVHDPLAGILGGDTITYLKETLKTFADLEKAAKKGDKTIPKMWRLDVEGFAALMSSAGYQRGLDYVPSTPFFAKLHEGEKVLSPEEAAWYRKQQRDGSIGGRSVNINVTIQALDTKSMEQAAREKLIPILKRAIENNTGGISSTITNNT